MPKVRISNRRKLNDYSYLKAQNYLLKNQLIELQNQQKTGYEEFVH